MDKYEYKLKLDEMKALTAEKKYEAAAEIADTFNWNKIKNVNALIKAAEIYENIGRYEESKELLLLAYDRSPIGRMILYRLTMVAVKMGAFEDAKEYYHEFVEVAPHDSLKYVLKYEICKGQGADVSELISILEDLKEQEYSEEWAYELAHLYHEAGMSDKCIEACDELILWFGEGPYVERALELKMLYQPLTKQQEEKYRQYRLKQNGVVEVTPDETLESGEIVSETVQIPKVQMTAERFNTQNLQEELQRSMQQIMDATEKETVDDSMDNIKKLVEEIPYLQIPKEETVPAEEEIHIETDAEIDDSLKSNFRELLAEDQDGQISLLMPEQGQSEPQVSGQMSIEDVLAEWERTRRAAEVALQEAEQRKLESAKARALQEAGDIMDRLADVIPKLDSGLTPRELLEEQYLAGQPMQEDKAAQVVANMNQILQQEIDRLAHENAEMDEQLAAAGGVPEVSTVELSPVDTTEPEIDEDLEELHAQDLYADDLQEEEIVSLESDAIPESDVLQEETVPEEEQPAEEPSTEDQFAEDQNLAETDSSNSKMEIAEDVTPLQGDHQEADALEMEYMGELASGIQEVVLPESETKEEPMPEAVAEDKPAEQPRERKPIEKLSKEQKELFSYFVPVRGMEKQICHAMNGAIGQIEQGDLAAGNLIIQGGAGSGKTVLATDMIKAIQKETGMLSGKIGKIEAGALNQKEIGAVLEKTDGGCLIIEEAGALSAETASKLSHAIDEKKDGKGTLIILEDTRRGIDKVMARDAGFASKFSERITIPVFTSDELVEFAKAYAREMGYTIDEMGILALYNSISSIQKYDQATTLTEVCGIVDDAIAKSERGSLKKAFSILASRRYDADDYVILHERDFGF